jgi:pyruvate dehydrogenase E2 component (dihydrolipoamide acetyltransferase)
VPTDVIMPALGMAQETGKVLRWLKGEGDDVAKGEPLLEVETDKVTVEIEAPVDGRLAALRAGEGAEVPVGEAVAVIVGAGEDLPTTNESIGAVMVSEPSPTAAAVPEAVPAAAATAAPRRRLASPKARRVAEERGIDLDSLVGGSGPHGALVAADIPDGGPAPAAPGGEELPLSRIWSIMAERMTQSWTSAPHFYLLREVDAGRLGSWREVARGRLGREVSVTDLLVRATAAALGDRPRLNAAWADGSIHQNDEVNVGIAVAVEDGLVVPVIHGADRIGLGAIAERREDIVARARESALRPEDVERGTFTISNLGMFGVDAFNAVVNPPQAAILAVGRIVDRVAAHDGAPVVRPTMVLTLSCDHRVVDGARAAQFLDALATLIEEPAGLAD